MKAISKTFSKIKKFFNLTKRKHGRKYRRRRTRRQRGG